MHMPQANSEVPLTAFRIFATVWLVYEAFFSNLSLLWMTAIFLGALIWASTSNFKLNEMFGGFGWLAIFVAACAISALVIVLLATLTTDKPVTWFSLWSMLRAGIGVSLIMFAANIFWHTRLEGLAIKIVSLLREKL